MTTSNQRKAIRKRHRLENERAARRLEPLNIPVKGQLKTALKRDRKALRESQYDQRQKVSIMLPGVKVRGKIGPSGEQKLKTWLRKGETEFVPLESKEHIAGGRDYGTR